MTHIAAVALLAHANEATLGDDETRPTVEADVLLTRRDELLYDGRRGGRVRYPGAQQFVIFNRCGLVSVTRAAKWSRGGSGRCGGGCSSSSGSSGRRRGSGRCGGSCCRGRSCDRCARFRRRC